jgi:hypothetical protein
MELFHIFLNGLDKYKLNIFGLCGTSMYVRDFIVFPAAKTDLLVVDLL